MESKTTYRVNGYDLEKRFMEFARDHQLGSGPIALHTYLRIQCNSLGWPLWMNFTWHDACEILSMSRPTLYKHLKTLQEFGIISWKIGGRGESLGRIGITDLRGYRKRTACKESLHESLHGSLHEHETLNTNYITFNLFGNEIKIEKGKKLKIAYISENKQKEIIAPAGLRELFLKYPTIYDFTSGRFKTPHLHAPQKEREIWQATWKPTVDVLNLEFSKNTNNV